MAPRPFLRPAVISIHALREEGDTTGRQQLSVLQHFYPRPPRGGRRRGYRDRPDSVDFYPRPPRGGRPRNSPAKPIRWSISIHALREEGDLACTELTVKGEVFLSTPSARRATSCPTTCRR